MSEDVKAFCQRLNIRYSDDLLPFYEKGREMYNELGNYIVDKQCLIKHNQNYNIFRR